MARNKVKNVSVSHETVLVSPPARPLHILTLHPKRREGESRLKGLIASVDNGPIAGLTLGPPTYQPEVERFYGELRDRWNRPDWRATASLARFTSREYDMGARILMHELARCSSKPRRLARAAMASLTAPPPLETEAAPTTASNLIPVVAADLFSRLQEESDELESSPAQIRMLLTIASDSARLRRDPLARARESEYRRHEIPYALSPRTRTDRLEEVIGSVRVVALLPLTGGAIEATTCLSQGQFLLAGECAIGGTVISMILAAGVALAERTLAAGQRDQDPDIPAQKEPDEKEKQS